QLHIVIDARLVRRRHQLGLERETVLLDRFEHWRRQGIEAVFDRFVAGEVFVPGDGDAGGLNDALDGGHEVMADFAALDEGDAESHRWFPNRRDRGRMVWESVLRPEIPRRIPR